MQLSNTKRIIVEDFKSEDRETVAKLATILNAFMDEVIELSRKNINFDNLNRSLVTIDISVDATGKPMGVTQINTNLATYKGKNIVDVQSLKAGVANVISTPYLDCTPQGNGIVRINKIYGLPVGTKVRVTIEFIG
jgi:hypothetical protein